MHFGVKKSFFYFVNFVRKRKTGEVTLFACIKNNERR